MRDERPTTPPTTADDQTRAFEVQVKEQGEGRARWARLLALLSENQQEQAQ